MGMNTLQRSKGTLLGYKLHFSRETEDKTREIPIPAPKQPTQGKETPTVWLPCFHGPWSWSMFPRFHGQLVLLDEKGRL